MKEMDISPEQFEDACQMAEGILSAKLHQNLFEQIWAASDFDTFKRMMIQLNIDLQLHALEVMASKYGLVPDSFLFDGISKEQFQQEDPLFKEAIRRSLAEIEPPANLLNMVEVHQIPDNIINETTDGTGLKCESSDRRVEPVEEGKNLREKSAKSFMQRIWRKEANASEDRKEGISVDEIKSRQEYLR